MSKLERKANSHARKLDVWGTMPRRDRRLLQGPHTLPISKLDRSEAKRVGFDSGLLYGSAAAPMTALLDFDRKPPNAVEKQREVKRFTKLSEAMLPRDKAPPTIDVLRERRSEAAKRGALTRALHKITKVDQA